MDDADGGKAVPTKGGAKSRAEESANAGPKSAKHAPKSAKPAGPSKNRLREQTKAEQAVEAAEAALRVLEDELADPAAWATKYEAAKSEARHTAAKRVVEAAYERLSTLVD